MPNMMNDSISSVVMTGRRMQSSERDMSARPLLGIANLDLGALGKEKRSVDDDALAAVQSHGHDDFAVLRTAGRDRLHMGGAVDDREDVIAALADLHGRARHHDDIRIDAQHH